ASPRRRRDLPRPPALRAHRRRAHPRRRPRLRARRHPGRADPHAGDQPARRPPRGVRRRRGPRPGGPRGARGHLGLRRRRRPHRRRGGAAGRGGRRRREGLRQHQHRPGRARARAGVPGRRVRLRLRRGPLRGARHREVGPADRPVGAVAGRGRRRARADPVHAREGAEVLRRHRRHPCPPAADPHLAGVHRPHRRPGDRLLREHAHAGPAGGPRLGVPDRHRLGLARGAGRDPGAAAREDQGPVGHRRPARPRRGPVQPVADHPRVGRARHRARPRAGLRGRLRRDVVRHRRHARHPAVRLAADERHRRPDGPARAGHGRLGRRGGRRPAVGHRQGRRPRRLPDRPQHGPPPRPGPVQRLRLRRLAGPRAGAADGERLAAARPGGPLHRRAHRGRRARHLRRRRQELVDRHAAVQLPVHRPALLPDRGRPAGRPGARRRLPGDDDGLLGRHDRGRRARHVRAGWRDELRQGPARAGRAGQPRLPGGAVRERERPQHGAGGRAM
ncbi:MAG: TldD family protein, Actinobacterial subgroup, partial [uncultured Blastococcus sp.]